MICEQHIAFNIGTLHCNMCLISHNWKITDIINSGYYETIFGDRTLGYRVRQKCIDCKKIKFGIIDESNRNKYSECVFIMNKNNQKSNDVISHLSLS